jgi:hypothetical protein
VYIHNGILFKLNEEGTSVIKDTMTEAGGHYFDIIQPLKEKYSSDSIYIRYVKQSNS